MIKRVIVVFIFFIFCINISCIKDGVNNEYIDILPSYSFPDTCNKGNLYLKIDDNTKYSIFETITISEFSELIVSSNYIRKVNQNGEIIWSFDRENIKKTQTYLYPDSSIITSDYAKIIKIDSYGNILWEYERIYNTNSNSVFPTNDGGCLCCYTSSNKIYINKVDCYGNEIWSKSYTANNEFIHNSYSYCETSENNYFLITDLYLGDSDYHDFVIRKIDSLGNIVLQKTMHLLDNDVLCSTSATKDGGIYLVGSLGNQISKINDDLSIAWTIDLGIKRSFMSDTPLVVVLSDNSLVCLIVKDAKCDDPRFEKKFRHMAICRYNENGILLWERTIGNDLCVINYNNLPGSEFVYK